MRKIAHIINPVVVSKSSDLYKAQPITFETMKLAKNYARLLKEAWLPNYILKLYEQTQHYCVEKAKK